ncbi:hypothetical protein ACFPM0_19615 [Pseudonocardia sulfidoxydans]|uniref:hypothetical protein n=1 Tax=Pseudonocardia sulfidoxydans TaxID=54011 RepID=UPI0036220374
MSRWPGCSRRTRRSRSASGASRGWPAGAEPSRTGRNPTAVDGRPGNGEVAAPSSRATPLLSTSRITTVRLRPVLSRS